MSTISAGTTLGTALVLSGDTNGNLVVKTGASATTAATFDSGGTVTLSSVTAFTSGTASAPAITTTGDTDTGIYFPTANQAAITTGGTVAAAFNSNGLFFRNRIINGDMRIDQRNAGASVTPSSNDYTIDRYKFALSQTSKLTTQQNAGSVTPPTGFVNYLGITSSSAYSVLSGDFFFVKQIIEGTNVADLGWGAAGALTVTMSFWVRSSLTGTFGGSIRNSAFNRSYPFSYTISSANTWEYKTVTIPGDTTGTWLTTTGTGLDVSFSFGTGSTYSGTAGAWAAANYVSATGAVSVVGTNGATFYITGVQLETGSVATPFERRPFTTELQLCQRYYEKSFNIGTAPVEGANTTYTVTSGYATNGAYSANLLFKVTKRAAPTITLYRPTVHATNGAWGLYKGSTNWVASTSTAAGITDSSFYVEFNSNVADNNGYAVVGSWVAAIEL